MVDVAKAHLFSSVLSEIRRTLEKHGFCELLTPSLLRNAPVPYRAPYQLIDQKLNDLAVGQPATESIALALKDLQAVYSIQTIYRLADKGPNHLQEFHYVKLGMRAYLPTLLDLVEGIAGTIGRMVTHGSPSDPPKRLTFDDARTLLNSPKGADITLAQQLQLVDLAGPKSASVSVMNRPKVFEPLQYDVDTAAPVFNADILMRHCGEVGGGYQVAVGRASAAYQASEYRQEALRQGMVDIDSCAGAYVRTVDGLSDPICLGGFSFERLMQSSLGVADIADVPVFSGAASIMCGGSAMT